MKPSRKTTVKAASEGASPAVATETVKRRPGQPTLYREEYCDTVIEWGKQGKSRTWMAANLGIDRKTIDNWADANPEFFLALSRAKALEQAHWEDLGYSGLTADKFNSGIWTKSMAARFPDDWREKHEHMGPSGGAIPHMHEVVFVVEDPAQA